MKYETVLKLYYMQCTHKTNIHKNTAEKRNWNKKKQISINDIDISQLFLPLILTQDHINSIPNIYVYIEHQYNKTRHYTVWIGLEKD